MSSISSLKDKYKLLPAPARASYWFLVCGVIQKGLTLLTTPIFTRLMETDEYGLFNVYNSWGSILTILISLNLASGVYLRGLIKYEEDRRSFSCSLYSLAVLLFAAWFLIILLFRGTFENLMKLPFYYIVLMLVDIFVCATFHFWSAEQRVEFKYMGLVSITLINAVMQTVIGIIAVMSFEDKVLARVISIVGSDVLFFAAFAVLPFIERPGKIRTSYWKYALSFNIPLVPHYLSQVILNQSDRIMIQRYDSASSAGLYGLAYSLASVLSIVNTAIVNTLTPWMYKKIKEKDYQSINKYSLIILSLVAGLNLMLIMLAPEAIMIFAPAEYYEAVYVVPPVAASVFFIFLYSWFSIFEFYFEKTYLMAVASVIGALENIILNYIFIHKYGFLAAGYTTLFCYILYVIGHYIFMRKICRQQLNGIKIYNMKVIVSICVVFVGAAALLMGLYRYFLIRLSIFLMVLMILFIARKRIIRFVKSLVGEYKMA